jgi:Ca2+-binding EF-hand superfamily protein
MKKLNDEETLKKAFQIMDVNKSGSIQKNLIIVLLRYSGFSIADAQNIIKQMTLKTGSNTIGMREFVRYFLRTTKYKINVK